MRFKIYEAKHGYYIVQDDPNLLFCLDDSHIVQAVSVPMGTGKAFKPRVRVEVLRSIERRPHTVSYGTFDEIVAQWSQTKHGIAQALIDEFL